MVRCNFFIDGFNFYHSLKGNPDFSKYKWIDYTSLCESFLKENQRIIDIYYFTALAYWNQGKVERHKKLIEVNEHIGIKTIYGKFRDRDINCRLCLYFIYN